MAVAGCPIEDTKHAIAMAEYALAMLSAIKLVAHPTNLCSYLAVQRIFKA